jgi:hypothetical protein
MNTNTNEECPICMESIGRVNCCTTECGHSYHSSCLFKNFSNSVDCPLCRKELIIYPEDEEDSSESSDEDDQSLDQEEQEEQEDDKPPITLNQIIHALKKQGFSDKDLLNSILMNVWFEDDEVSDEDVVRNGNLIDMIYSIINKEVAVDYRDSRTYANVLLGISKTDETGEGPKPIF